MLTTIHTAHCHYITLGAFNTCDVLLISDYNVLENIANDMGQSRLLQEIREIKKMLPIGDKVNISLLSSSTETGNDQVFTRKNSIVTGSIIEGDKKIEEIEEDENENEESEENRKQREDIAVTIGERSAWLLPLRSIFPPPVPPKIFENTSLAKQELELYNSSSSHRREVTVGKPFPSSGSLDSLDMGKYSSNLGINEVKEVDEEEEEVKERED